MILNGAVFIGVGVLLLKTSDDPVRATLFWTANPVLIQQLVSGGHLDTFVAAAAICAIQVARRVPDVCGDVLVGVLIGLGLRDKDLCGADRVRAWPGRCSGGANGCAPPGSPAASLVTLASGTAPTGWSR